MKVLLVVLALVAIVHCHVLPLGLNKHKVTSLKGIQFVLQKNYFKIISRGTFLLHRSLTFCGIL
jgi:hypothetical protein